MVAKISRSTSSFSRMLIYKFYSLLEALTELIVFPTYIKQNPGTELAASTHCSSALWNVLKGITLNGSLNLCSHLPFPFCFSVFLVFFSFTGTFCLSRGYCLKKWPPIDLGLTLAENGQRKSFKSQDAPQFKSITIDNSWAEERKKKRGERVKRFLPVELPLEL